MSFTKKVLSSEKKFLAFVQNRREKDLNYILKKTNKPTPSEISIAKKVWKSVEYIFRKILVSVGTFASRFIKSKVIVVHLAYQNAKIRQIKLKYMSEPSMLLVSTLNYHSKTSRDLYTLTPCSKPNVNQYEVEFYHPNGVCRGASLWFLSLYSELKRRHPEIEQRKLLIALAKRFQYGAPTVPGLIQGMLKKIGAFHSHPLIEKATGIKFKQFPQCVVHNETTLDEQAELIENLPDGEFHFQSPLHAMAVIKSGDSIYYFDPNRGLFEYNQNNNKNFFMDVKTRYPLHKIFKDFFHSFSNKSLEEEYKENPHKLECAKKILSSITPLNQVEQLGSTLSTKDKKYLSCVLVADLHLTALQLIKTFVS